MPTSDDDLLKLLKAMAGSSDAKANGTDIILNAAVECIEEHERSFDLRWKADMRAIALWQAAHPGNEHVWPDHADLCVWLMEQYDEKIEAHQEALQSISQWADAYPVSIFPEPDLAKAARLLNDGGITLDAISAHCMRHVIAGVGAIAKKALGEQ